jgi:hypothetical protein
LSIYLVVDSVHEYVAPFTLVYHECIDCKKRTPHICIECNYCYSCHPNIERIEKQEERDEKQRKQEEGQLLYLVEIINKTRSQKLV